MRSTRWTMPSTLHSAIGAGADMVVEVEEEKEEEVDVEVEAGGCG